MRVVFFGTPVFAAEILVHLLEKGVNIVGVVTMPDRPQGRSSTLVPSPVKVVWLEEGLKVPLIQEEQASSEEGVAQIAALNPDLFIVVGFGEILKPSLLSLPKIAAINIHTSLLPKYRGAAPIQRAIMAGETHMGITVIKMNAIMDDGEMIGKRGADIAPTWDFPDIERKLILLAKEEIIEVLERFKTGRVDGEKQDRALVTLAPKILPEDSIINWSLPAQVILNQIRALTPKPAASSMLQIGEDCKRLKIYKAWLYSTDCDRMPGEILIWNKSELVVQTGQGALQILDLQIEGRSRVSPQDFYAGYSGKKVKFIW